MITVDIVSKLTGKIKRRYLCKSMNTVRRLEHKYRYKLWVKLDIDDYDVVGKVEVTKGEFNDRAKQNI